MPTAPLRRLAEILPAHVRAVAERAPPIPTLAAAAKQAKLRHPALVRGDIGQIVGVQPDAEVLYGPPVGLPALRAALAEYANLTYGLADRPGFGGGIGAEHVAICSGAAEALSLLFECFGSERRVGLPRGHWENYDNGVALARGEACIIDFFDDDGRLDTAALRRQLEHHKVDALVVNFPCNPTGAVLSPGETRALAEAAIASNVLVIADEVYARLRYDGKPAQSLLAHAPDHVVSIGSASKEYLLPGGRVGYLLCAHADFTSRVMHKLIRARTASPNVLGQEKLLARLLPDLEDMRAGKAPRLIAQICGAMRQRRDALISQLQAVDMGLHGRAPEGTIFLMATLPDWWDGDDQSFCEQAIERGLASGIPGSAFGLPGTVRFSFGAMTLEDIARLGHQLRGLRA